MRPLDPGGRVRPEAAAAPWISFATPERRIERPDSAGGGPPEAIRGGLVRGRSRVRPGGRRVNSERMSG